ncbi:MAG TPA: FAD-dependent monooxygenase, partial [Ilumatobacteraceae bacterium]|nr:FAD-dependent monooxygenase [Ilumatobacteraceae bacterium]
MRTKVAIVGGGPAGMLLSHLLWRSGVDNVVVEQRSREYVEARVRAGVIEQGTSDLLRSLGLGSRMDREGFVHEGVTISNSRTPFRVDFASLVNRVVMVYGQTEIQKDLYDSASDAGWPVVFEAESVELHGLTND